jgi:hypothetical protein
MSDLLNMSSTIYNPDPDQLLLNSARFLGSMVDAVRPEDSKRFTPNCATAREPTANNVYIFLATLFGIGQWTPECNMIMMVLILVCSSRRQ